ncbi:MAG TPA: zf-HC2 domain-containing protein [bacterium]|nr:zf-HC2 domain-containing protein [bacterium]HPR87743.1 zf-HC2 domain-containing protein [bacterium]
MSDHPAHSLHVLYLYGELTPRQREEMEAHHRTCPACRAELQQLQGAKHHYEDLAWTEPPAAMVTALQAAARREQLRLRAPRLSPWLRSERPWLQAAATIAIVILGAVLVSRPPHMPLQEKSSTRPATAAAENTRPATAAAEETRPATVAGEETRPATAAAEEARLSTAASGEARLSAASAEDTWLSELRRRVALLDLGEIKPGYSLAGADPSDALIDEELRSIRSRMNDLAREMLVD